MSKKLLPIIIVLGSFLLFACSSPDNTPNPNDQPIESQQEQIQPTETSPMAQESAPTEEPQETPTMESPTESFQEAQLDSDSLCYHPYFPIIDGASWTFDDELGEDYTLRIEETGEDSFTMTQEMLNENAVFTVEWYCSEDGILRGSFGQLDLISQAEGDEESPEFQFQTLEWEGQTLPSPELMEIGYTWTSFYQLSASLDFELISQSIKTEVIVDHEIAGIEEVTVPAGTFSEAIRVDSDGFTFTVLVEEENSKSIGSLNFKYSTWYVENLGMVKSSTEVSGYSTDVSLSDSSLLD